MVRICIFCFVIIAVVLFTTSCSTVTTQEPIVNTITVKVPVLQCPANHIAIVRPQRPELIISSLTAANNVDPGKVVKAYKATVKQLEQYATTLEIGFDGYRTMCVAAGSDDEVK